MASRALAGEALAKPLDGIGRRVNLVPYMRVSATLLNGSEDAGRAIADRVPRCIQPGAGQGLRCLRGGAVSAPGRYAGTHRHRIEVYLDQTVPLIALTARGAAGGDGRRAGHCRVQRALREAIEAVKK